MTKMLVEDTSLVAVADAIRTKGGTTNALVFPDGFVSAIEGIQSGTNYAIAIVDGSLTEITADMLEGCTKIRKNVFSEASIYNAVLPETVTSIETNAFRDNPLSTIVLPSKLTSIGTYAFYNCVWLTSVLIPSEVTSIGVNAFRNCSRLTTLEMKPTTPPTLGSYAIANSGLTQIIVPAGSLSAYQSATNWSDYADLMVERWDLSNAKVTVEGSI